MKPDRCCAAPLGHQPPGALSQRRAERLHSRHHLQRHPHHGQPRPRHRQRAVRQLQHHHRSQRQPDQGLGQAHPQGRHLHAAQPQGSDVVRQRQRQLQFRRQPVQPLRHRLRLLQRAARRLQHLQPGQRLHQRPVPLLEYRAVRAGHLEGNTAPHPRLRHARRLVSAAVRFLAAGLHLRSEPLGCQPRRRASTSRPSLPAPPPDAPPTTRPPTPTCPPSTSASRSPIGITIPGNLPGRHLRGQVPVQQSRPAVGSALRHRLGRHRQTEHRASRRQRHLL